MYKRKVKHGEGSDPASVVFDGIAAAKARGAEVLIIDTAGRLHNKANLMNELSNMRRIISRELPEADIETLMVVDATTGQNGLIQAKQFAEAADITGIVLTKLCLLYTSIFMFLVEFGGFSALSEAIESSPTVTDAAGNSKTFSPMMMTAFGTYYTGVQSLTYLMCPVIGVACQPSALTRMYAVKRPQDLPRAGMTSAISQALVAFSAMSIAFAMLVLVPSGQAPAVAIADQVDVYKRQT